MGESFAWKVLGPGQSCRTVIRGLSHLVISFASLCEIVGFFHRLFSIDSGFHTMKAAVSSSSIEYSLGAGWTWEPSFATLPKAG